MITGGKSFVSSPPTFSNDAKRLLVCTGNTVSIFSTSTGLQTSELAGHEEQVTSVIVVPATTLASKVMCHCWTSSLDGKIKYWDFSAPELMRTIDVGFPIHSMVIPSLLSHPAESNRKVPDLFAYIYTEHVPQKEEQSKNCGKIRKCNLTKSRLVGGVILAETKKPGSFHISPTGKYIGAHVKRKLRIWEIPAEDSDNVGYKKLRLHHTKSITALAFHPTERVVAAGDVTGRILIWRGVGCGTFSSNDKSAKGKSNKNAEDRPGVRDDDDADSCTTWHWHSAQVNVLFFSSDGAYLYSGGKEGVLVVWQLDTGKKKFLPRIGSSLVYFVNSPDPSMSSISCADNRIQLLRMPTMEVMKSISGIKLRSSPIEMYEGFGSNIVFENTAGLIAVPTENYRVQFYNLFSDREISEVQICEKNYLPGDEITFMTAAKEGDGVALSFGIVGPGGGFAQQASSSVVKVNLVALSPDGSTMSTVETRLPEDGIGSLVSLKFWACGSQGKQVSLSTVIYEPHRDAEISSIAFRPTSHMAVSTSYGGDFKVWVRKHEIPSEDQALQNTGWACHSLGSYKKKPMTAAAFSSDGSVFAIAAQEVITLWDPERNALLAVVEDRTESITNLSFVGKSEYLVSLSRGSNPRLNVWGMSNLRTTWSYRLDTEAIACSMYNSTFAVLVLSSSSKHSVSAEAKSPSEDGVILLFDAENPVPVSTWFVSKAQGGKLGFVQLARQLDDNVSKTKAANEVLAYVNGVHEYVLFSPNGELASELSISCQQNFSSLEDTGKFGYASIYGELPEFSLKTTETPFPHVPSDKAWKTIFSGPSHSLPPLPKLCSDFLESLLERRPAIS